MGASGGAVDMASMDGACRSDYKGSEAKSRDATEIARRQSFRPDRYTLAR